MLFAYFSPQGTTSVVRPFAPYAATCAPPHLAYNELALRFGGAPF